MPMFDYQCPKCDAVKVDVFMLVADLQKGKAPKCHKCRKKMKRLISPPRSVQVKQNFWESEDRTVLYSTGRSKEH